MFVSGMGVGSGMAKSATHAPAPNGFGVVHWARRRMPQVVGNGSQKNSSSVRAFQARDRVKYPMPLRNPATGEVHVVGELDDGQAHDRS